METTMKKPINHNREKDYLKSLDKQEFWDFLDSLDEGSSSMPLKKTALNKKVEKLNVLKNIIYLSEYKNVRSNKDPTPN